MMGRFILFTSWASLLVAALFFADYTNKLQNIDREAVATMKLVSGKVFQRPENYSVYELLNVRDSIYNGDFISTGAASRAEVQLLNSKTIIVGENSLIQISFGVNAQGLGSDIVTLLKGVVSAKAEVASISKKADKKLSFKVGMSSLNDVESADGVEISKNLEQREASIKVVAGSAQIVGEDNVVREVKKDQVVVVAAAKLPSLQVIENTEVEKNLPVSFPVINVAPAKIATTDSRIMTAPVNLNGLNFASKELVEDIVEVNEPPKKVWPSLPESSPVAETQPVNLPPIVPIEKVQAKEQTPVVTPPVDVASIPKDVVKELPNFNFVLYSSSPQVFVGTGLYFVKNQSLFAKVEGKPSKNDLIALAKQYNVSFYYEGKAEAFVGGFNQENLATKDVVYAVDKNGIQKVDAALLRTRPAAMQLLRNGGYTIFDEKVNVLSIGH